MGHSRVPKCSFHSPRGSQQGWERRVCLSQSPTALPPTPCTDQGVQGPTGLIGAGARKLGSSSRLRAELQHQLQL